jgi:adenine deaminase
LLCGDNPVRDAKNVGIGFVRGFKLKKGALGSTVADDAHNVVPAAVNDSDIFHAIQALERLQRGQLAGAGGAILAQLPPPVAGIVSDRPLEELIRRPK